MLRSGHRGSASKGGTRRPGTHVWWKGKRGALAQLCLAWTGKGKIAGPKSVRVEHAHGARKLLSLNRTAAETIVVPVAESLVSNLGEERRDRGNANGDTRAGTFLHGHGPRWWQSRDSSSPVAKKCRGSIGHSRVSSRG